MKLLSKSWIGAVLLLFITTQLVDAWVVPLARWRNSLQKYSPTTAADRCSASTTISPFSSPRTSSTCLHGIKATIRIVGRKSSEKWIEDGCRMYETRLAPNNIDVSTEWYKSNDALIKSVSKHRGGGGGGAPLILLDPRGKESKSEDFSDQFYKWVEQGGSRIVFVIGGAEGLPPDLRSGSVTSQPVFLYSLSKLTFTHQFARLVLIEQICRASEIKKGSGYHK